MMESPSDTSSVQPALSRETPHRHSPAPPPPDRYHAMPSSSSPTPLAAPPRSSRGAFTYPMRSPSLALRPLCFGLESPQRDSPAPPPPCSVPLSSTTLATPPRSSRAASTYPLPSPSLKLPRSFHRDTPHCDSPVSDYAKLYAVSESEIMLVAELEHMPARGNSYEYRGGVEPSTAEASGELLLAYFHKGLLDRMASFIFLEDQSESDRSDTGESEEKEEGSDEEEENDRESEEEEGADEEQENDGESEEEEEESEEEDSDDQSLESYFLELRMWPTRANLVLYDSRSWVFTRAYCLQWLSTKQVEPLVKMIKESGDDIKVDDSLFVNLPPTGRSKLQGPMVSSRAVNKFVEIKLCPSLIDFRVKELLGKGATSNVRLCTYIPVNKEYAVKIDRLNEDDEIQSEPREVTILSDLRNEFVVRFSQAWVESDNLLQYESATDDEPSSDESSDGAKGLQCSKYLMIHMEYCPRTLQNYLSPKVRKFEAQVSSHFFGEITKGLRYIHKEGVIHRDLKPGNVFLSTDGSIKIADFGQSCFRPNDLIFFKATPNLGTVFYEAPELKAGEHISEKVDIYSLGIIYFELFNCFKGTMFQKHEELLELRENDQRGKTWEGDSSLCRQMIAKDPLGRPSADEITEILYKSTRSSKKGEKEELVDRFHSVGK